MCFRQQNARFRRLRASFLHTTIINLRAEIKDPRAKEIIDSARKRFPGAAHGQPPPTAEAAFIPDEFAVFSCRAPKAFGTRPVRLLWARWPSGTGGLGGASRIAAAQTWTGMSVNKHEKRREVQRAGEALHKGVAGSRCPWRRGGSLGNLPPPWAGGESSDPHLSLVTANLSKPLSGRLLPLFETPILRLSLAPHAFSGGRSERPGRGCPAPLRPLPALASSSQGPSWGGRGGGGGGRGGGLSPWRRSLSRRGRRAVVESPLTQNAASPGRPVSSAAPPAPAPRLASRQSQHRAAIHLGDLVKINKPAKIH
ncbi:uncharacterized protein LOC131585082 [Poecile atricapillus]|uniref:uncharacterized protein LOC131585082 n=1 Tax=Poecile atricapillus TaxID=48891 RepID=UPI0027393604|nr:uncharacterized protein LOC131585082 [Poecile atricapillus]